MKLFPNSHNNRVFLRFAACLVAGGAVFAVLVLAVPPFPGWQAVGPGVLMLLVAVFVLPYATRQPPGR